MLELAYNKITEIRKKTFIGLQNVIWLHLENNIISSVYPAGLQYLINLEKLNCKNNQLQHLCYETFKGLQKLKVLDLSKNSLCTIEIGTFADLKKLQFLLLADNNLTIINQDLFKGIISPIVLEFQKNNISMIQTRSFHLNFTRKSVTILYSQVVPLKELIYFYKAKNYSKLLHTFLKQFK